MLCCDEETAEPKAELWHYKLSIYVLTLKPLKKEMLRVELPDWAETFSLLEGSFEWICFYSTQLCPTSDQDAF